MTNDFLMLVAIERGEIARQLQQHSLLWYQLLLTELRTVAWFSTLEEVVYPNAKRERDLIETPGRNPIDRSFVLVGLLIRHTY